MKSLRKTSLLVLSTQSLHLDRRGNAPSQAKLKDGFMSLRRNYTRSIRFLHKFTNWKGGKAAIVNLQSYTKVLRMMKLRHKDRLLPSQCAISFQKTFSITRSRLLAMKIVRNASPKLLDKFTISPRPHESKLHDTKLLVCTSIKGNTNAPCSHEPKLHEPKLLVRTSLNCRTQSSSPT